jgi:hypothetical protein
MRRQVLWAACVLGLWWTTAAATASEALPPLGCPPVICVSQCPPYPDLVCQGWGCPSDIGCGSEDCGGQSYTLRCEIKQT